MNGSLPKECLSKPPVHLLVQKNPHVIDFDKLPKIVLKRTFFEVFYETDVSKMFVFFYISGFLFPFFLACANPKVQSK